MADESRRELSFPLMPEHGDGEITKDVEDYLRQLEELLRTLFFGVSSPLYPDLTSSDTDGPILDPGSMMFVGSGGGLVADFGTKSNQLIYTSYITFDYTWTDNNPGDASDDWRCVACDSDMSNIIVAAYGDRIYTSADYGKTWTERQPAGDANKNWEIATSDADGSNLMVGVSTGRLYTSDDSGANWTERQPDGAADKGWLQGASDSDGSFLVVTNISALFTSADSGATWTERQPAGAGSKNWVDVACDDDGSVVVVADSSRRLWISTDSGVTWTEAQPDGDRNRTWASVACNNDGSTIVVSHNQGGANQSVFISTNTGSTWTNINPTGVTGEPAWNSLEISDDGQVIAVGNSVEKWSGAAAGFVFISFDGGSNWQKEVFDGASTPHVIREIAMSTDGSRLVVGAAQSTEDGGVFTSISTDLATWDETTFTSFIRTLLDDTSASEVRDTLGLGTGDSPEFTGLTLSGLTASRITATNASKALSSVGDLTSWIAGTTDHISVTDDSDGTVTLDLDTNTKTLLGSFNGIFLEKFDFTISEAGGTVTGSLEQDGTGDLIQRFSDGYTTLDCTPALTIDLTAYVGSNAVPKEVFVYILQSAKTVMAASNSDWPGTEHCKVAHLVLKSAITTGTDGGALVNQNVNDFASAANGEGHISHVEERLRKEPARWDSGTALTLKNSGGAELTTTSSSTAVELVVATGQVYQLHRHTFPAFDMYTTATDDAHVVNQPTDEGGAYETTADLVTDVTHYVDGTAAGVSIGTNKYFNLVIWGIQNRGGEPSHLMINLPTGQYTTEAHAISDTDGTSVFDISSAFEGTGFLIARLTFRLIGGSQWTYIAQEDLRGQQAPISAGVSVSVTAHDLLAHLAFADAAHTGFLASDGSVALAGAWDMGSQALTNVNIDSGVITGITDLAIGDGGTGQGTAQAAIDALSAVSGATNEHVLTKDTGTGNAVFKVAAGGSDVKVGVDVAATAGFLGAASSDGVLRTGAGLSYTDGGDFITLVATGLLGDGTASRVFRIVQLLIDDGTNANTLKCTLSDIWNGDVIAILDNIAKNATTGDYKLTATGKGLRILATGLTGDPLASFVNMSYNDTATAIFSSSIIETEPSVEVSARAVTGGAQQDWTALVDSGDIVLQIMYITDA